MLNPLVHAMFNRVIVNNGSLRVTVSVNGELVIDPVTIWDGKRFACWIRSSPKAFYAVGKLHKALHSLILHSRLGEV